MMLCKQEARGVSLSMEQDEWLHDTDEEPNKQELKAHYLYMAKIQEVFQVTDENYGPTYDVEPLEKVQTDDNNNVFATERQHSEQHESIDDTYVVETVDSNVNPDSSNLYPDENKKIQNQLNKANTILTHKLNKCKSALEESNDIQDRSRSALHQPEIELEKYKVFKNCQLEKEEVQCC
nr:hypothetical protein [Tanacetum cinerariifolium]